MPLELNLGGNDTRIKARLVQGLDEHGLDCPRRLLLLGPRRQPRTKLVRSPYNPCRRAHRLDRGRERDATKDLGGVLENRQATQCVGAHDVSTTGLDSERHLVVFGERDRIPILNMLDETMTQVAERFPGRRVGLLATTGTVQSGVYAQAAEQAGVALIVPDAPHQARVMEAIYGPRGVKAGYTDGACREDLLAALRHLAERGAQVAILGCTELPLILPQDENFAIAGHAISLLDPTMLLAEACVRHARLVQGVEADRRTCD